MIQRDVRKRLGYSGISEIMEHPWLNFNRAEKAMFKSQLYESPIIPLEVNLNYSVQELTEPD